MHTVMLVLAGTAFVHPSLPALALTPVQPRSRPAAATSGSAPQQLNQPESDSSSAPAASVAGKVVPAASSLVAASEPRKPSGALASLPMVAALGALCYVLTLLLSGMTGPVAGGVKLIYAGAVAGIISRSACAPLEMVSTVMMCRRK